MSSSTEDAGAVDRIAVGRIGKPHGLHGEITVLPDTDDLDRFAVGSSFVTDTGRTLVIASVKPYRDKGLLLHFEGVRSRIEAENLRGILLTVDADTRRDLEEDEFWPDDLTGLDAVAPDGSVLGVVDRIEFGPGQDRLVVKTPLGVEVEVPFVSAIVGDPANGQIVIDAPEGLF
ncbi:MAG: 16S rRNA processing protein RimM [Acidobacteria bacterium]|nr:16S rRNA processing protein RimM [Acidobacteriota bacterium]